MFWRLRIRKYWVGFRVQDSGVWGLANYSSSFSHMAGRCKHNSRIVSSANGLGSGVQHYGFLGSRV